eukprot:7827935-Alexandrium_andersonii.AAC.1
MARCWTVRCKDDGRVIERFTNRLCVGQRHARVGGVQKRGRCAKWRCVVGQRCAKHDVLLDGTLHNMM